MTLQGNYKDKNACPLIFLIELDWGIRIKVWLEDIPGGRLRSWKHKILDEWSKIEAVSNLNIVFCCYPPSLASQLSAMVSPERGVVFVSH